LLSIGFDMISSYWESPVGASASMILFASFGGSNVNAESSNDGARFHVITDVNLGRAGSVVVVIISFRGSG
jgi:hypothetical protein